MNFLSHQNGFIVILPSPLNFPFLNSLFPILHPYSPPFELAPIKSFIKMPFLFCAFFDVFVKMTVQGRVMKIAK